MFAVNRLLEEDEEIDLANTDGDDSDYSASEESDTEVAALVEISQLEGIEFPRAARTSAQKLVVAGNQTGSAYVFTDVSGDRVDLPPGSVHVLAHPPGMAKRLEWCTLEAVKKGADSLSACLQNPAKTLCLKPLSATQWQRVCKEKVTASQTTKWSKGLWSALVQATTQKSNDDLIAKYPAITKCLPEPFVGWSHCKPTPRKPTKPAAPASAPKPTETPKVDPETPPEPPKSKPTPPKRKAEPDPPLQTKTPPGPLPTPPPLKRTKSCHVPTKEPLAEAKRTEYTLTVTSTDVSLLQRLAKNLECQTGSNP
jgi:hypothetical protein